MSTDALKRFELENGIEESDLFAGNAAKNVALRSAKPWATDPHYFKKVKISALALLKMAMHAKAGCPLEVMGVLQGKLEDNTFIVMDTFALPVEGSETRVTAMEESYEYMSEYSSSCEKAGRTEPVVGWYHSHPGYGCWLSGIDVSTQMTQQQHQDPYLAIVVDPIRTISAGKVEIGAFRTYPASYRPADEGPSEYQTIPLDKIEDFGVHCKQYYPLEVTFFKSSLDTHLISLLWNEYWINTLSTSPLLMNQEYTIKSVRDLAQKLEQAETTLAQGARIGAAFPTTEKRKEETQLAKITKDSSKIACEQVQGLMTQVVKDLLFNKSAPCGAPK